MYLNIIPPNKKERMIECDEYRVAINNQTDMVLIAEKEGKEKMIEIDKSQKYSVYIMNNTGQTINSYIFK